MHYLAHKLRTFPFYYSYQNPPLLDLPQNDPEVNSKFQNLYREYIDSKSFRELKIVNIINDIYITLARRYTADVDIANYSHPNYLKILEQFEQHIERYYDKQKLPKYYADKLNITTKHLNRIAKETVNKTTNQLISERVILEAKRLIVHSNSSLFSIAETLGFTEYAYFSRYFKTNTAMTPLEFRKRYIKE